MFGKLYDALRSAPGVTDAQAHDAAVEMATFDARLGVVERDLAVVKWMLGTLIVLVIFNLGLSFQILGRLPR